MSMRSLISTVVIAAVFVGVMLLPNQRPQPAGAQPSTRLTPAPSTVTKHELAVCSAEDVFIVAFAYDTAKKGQPILATKTWSWRARDCEDLTPKQRAAFAMTSECKAVDGGRKMIIAAKEGGFALVERETGKPLFTMVMPNRAYSGDLLPNDRVAIVSGDERAGSLCVYDIKSPDRPLFQQTLVGARGIVWDEERASLWAIGNSELRQYTLDKWRTPDATLKLEESYKLPAEDGSDLHLTPDRMELLLTTARGMWRFDITRRRFAADQILGSRDEIKSVSVHPASRLLAYVEPKGEVWWSDRVRLVGGEKDLIFPSSKIYKARWVISE